MHPKFFSALALFAALFVSTASAEERFPAGGITLDPKADVTIARQDVYLSIREVRVHYEYQSDAAQTVTMRFESPIVPIDEGPDHLGGAMLGEDADKTNYTQAIVEADGKVVTPTVREYAYFNGADITAELAALGVAPYINDVTELQNVFGMVDETKRAELVERGILVLDSYGEPSMVGWSYKSVLEWEQPLAAGTTALDIAYVPLNGYPSGYDPAYFGEGEDAAFVAQIRDFYCLDDGFNRAVKRKMETVPSFEVVELGYSPSLEEGARTVGEFSLTVDKIETAEDIMGGPLTFVAFCPADARKISDTAFQWTATDYTPASVNVVFYSFSDRFES